MTTEEKIYREVRPYVSHEDAASLAARLVAMAPAERERLFQRVDAERHDPR